MARFVSGVTDQVIYLVAVSSTDFTTRLTGLSSFTVYRSRNGGAATAFTTPTVTEVSAANMPGVYKLLLDEDMTIDAGDDSQEVALHITHAGMAPVTLTYELYRAKISAGETVTATGGRANADVTHFGGAAGTFAGGRPEVNASHWAGAATATDDLALVTAPANFAALGINASGHISRVTLADTITTYTGNTPQTGDSFALIGANGAGLSAIPWNAAWDAEVQSEVTDAMPANFAALGINASGHISRVTLTDTVTTYTGNTPQTGDAFARIGANGAGLSAVPWNAAWDAEAESEALDAMISIHLDHLLAAAAPGGGVPINNSFWSRLHSSSATPDYTTFNPALHSVQALSAGASSVIDSLAMRTGTAQAGSANSITLDAGASASDNFFNDVSVQIISGQGAGQVRSSDSYNGTTKVLTVKKDWVVQPNATSEFVIWAIPIDFADHMVNELIAPVTA